MSYQLNFEGILRVGNREKSSWQKAVGKIQNK
jgi:hypothetical protein